MSEKMNGMFGITDTPVTGERVEEKTIDLLGTDAYAKGLVSFITKCPTPMSIAIQGDWGSGKTSILNFVKEELDRKYRDNTETIFINTWQFSKLSEDQLFAAVFCAIKEELQTGRSEMVVESLKKLGDIALRIGVKSIGGDAEGTSFHLFETSYKQVQLIRNNFEKAIAEKLAGKPEARIVVLIDDLDRLNPGKAVDLLESMKLFMDVVGCVFVLAVDYDVVVRGVKEKYGEQFSLKRCGNFFDKIIQVPFHMPVEKYTMDRMVEEYLSPFIQDQKYFEVISKFTTEVIGKNPRAFKRMVNAFSLIMMIQANVEKSNQFAPEDFAALFCILCVQIQMPMLYEYIAESDFQEVVKEMDEEDSIGKKLMSRLNLEGTEQEKADEVHTYTDMLNQFADMVEKIYGTKKDRFEKLEAVLQLSSVTGRDDINRSSGRGAAKGVFHIVQTIEFMVDYLGTVVNDSAQVTTEMLRKGYTLGSKKVATIAEVTVSTIQSKCTRTLGYNVDEFLMTVHGFLKGDTDEIFIKLQNKCNEEQTGKLKEQMLEVQRRYNAL